MENDKRERINLALAQVIGNWDQKRDGDLVELARQMNTIAARVYVRKSAA